MRHIGCNGIKLLGTLPLVGRCLIILAAIVEGLELFKDEVKSVLPDAGRLRGSDNSNGEERVSFQ